MKRILFLSSCTYLLDQLEPRISLEEIWWSPDGLSTQKIKKKKKQQKKTGWQMTSIMGII